MRSVSFSPDGKTLASGSSDDTVKLWSIPTGKLLKTLKGHTDGVLSVSFSPDGKILASASDDTVKLLSIPTGQFITCLFDPAALEAGKKANTYTTVDAYGRTITSTLPCGSPIPAGAICTCNCVPGTYRTSSGGTYCTCDKICTCVPIK